MERLKTLLKKWVFSKEQKLLANEYAHVKRLAEEQEAYAKSLTISDLVRAQLKGFNPHLLNSHDELELIVGDEDSTDSFLAEAKKIAENSAFHRIADHIIRNQLQYSAQEAPTLDTINFGRASVNGVTLFREEVERMEKLYDARHASPEDFDVQEVL